MRFGLTIVGALAMLSLAPACSSGADTSGVSAAALTADGDGDVDCTLESQPAYSGGAKIGTVDVVQIDGKRVALKTAHAFLELRRRAEAEGIHVTINSGFRTMSEQQHLYDCYKTGSCNNGNLAARPGYSNHQNGRALDLGGDRTRLNALIRRLGLDWRRTVPSEAWHYEYFGPWVDGPCGAASSDEPAATTTPNDPAADTSSDDVADAPPANARPEPPPPATTSQDAQDQENLDPYDPNEPYDPYRDSSTPPARSVPPSPRPSTTQGGPAADDSLGGEMISIDTPPTGSPSSGPTGTTTPPTAPRPSPVTAAPEPEASYSPQAATTPPTVKKKAAASPPIQSGCAAAPARASDAPAAFLFAMAAAALGRRRAKRAAR